MFEEKDVSLQRTFRKTENKSG